MHRTRRERRGFRVARHEAVLAALGVFLFVGSALGGFVSPVPPGQTIAPGRLLGALMFAALALVPALVSLAVRWLLFRRRGSGS